MGIRLTEKCFSGETSKDIGGNVESDFDDSLFLHTFAPEIRNKKSNNKKIRNMKKMIFALVVMFAMTMSANAKSNDASLFFKRISCYLELDKNQMETVKVSMAEFNESMESLSHQRGRSKGFKSVNNIVDRHKKQMKQILSDKQYKKFEEIFDLTVRNTTKINFDRIVSSRSHHGGFMKTRS